MAALSELAKKVKRFRELHSKAKEINVELDALKAYFKDASKGSDTIFAYGDTEVVVTTKTRTGWDTDALMAHLGKLAKKFRPSSSYQEVSCRAVVNRTVA